MEPLEELKGAFAAHGSRRNLLVLQLAEFEGHRFLSIRRWYESGGGEWHPTRKGVALNRNGVEFLLRALKENEPAIQAWFDGDASETSRVRQTKDKEAGALRAAGYRARSFEESAEAWSSPVFFRVETEGSLDRLILNENHPASPELSRDVIRRQALGALLVSFERARRLLECRDERQSEDERELLDANWGLILRQYFGDPQR